MILLTPCLHQTYSIDRILRGVNLYTIQYTEHPNKCVPLYSRVAKWFLQWHLGAACFAMYSTVTFCYIFKHRWQLDNVFRIKIEICHNKLTVLQTGDIFSLKVVSGCRTIVKKHLFYTVTPEPMYFFQIWMLRTKKGPKLWSFLESL